MSNHETKHQKAAITNIKIADDAADHKERLGLLKVSVLMHAILYVGDQIGRIADNMERTTPS